MECNGKKTKVESVVCDCAVCTSTASHDDDDVAWLCRMLATRFQGADKLTLSGRDTEKGERNTLVLMNIVNHISRKYSH